MAGPLPGEPSLHGMKRYRVYNHLQNDLQEPFCSSPGWYLSRKEIEDHSPSRRDGIDLKKETQLQKLYCSFLQDLGIKLKVPQVTIATSMIFCHRFFLRQSHAKNEWQTIATVCIFLAAKVEETPRLLRDVVIVAYELVYRRDPAAVQRIRRKEVYEQQKELVIIGERLLLSTLGFDLNVQHPYKPLVAALKKFKIAQNELAKVAWNFVNDWLRTTLCLQFKPHYIAAGSICLAAKFHKVKLPSERGMVWWQEFDVTPRQLEEVIQQMLELLEQNRRAGSPTKCEKATQAPNVVEKAASNSPQSCVLRDSVLTCNSSPEITREMAREREPSANSMYQNSLGSRDPACSDTWASRKVYTECKTSDWRSCVMRGSVLTCNSCHGTTMEVGGETLVNLMYQKSLDIRNPAYNDIQVAETRDSQGQTSKWHSCVLNGSVLTCSSSQRTNWGVGGETSDYSMYQSSLGNQNPAYDDIRVAGNGESQGQTGDWNSCVINGSVLTCNSSYEANRDVARVTSMNLINQSSVGNRLLAYNDIQVAKKGELPCQAGDWHSFVQSRAVLTCSSSNETNREVGGEMENLIDQISLGKQDLACNDSSVAGKGEAQCQISDCGSTMMGTVGLEDCGRSDKGEPDQILAIKYRGERGETGISGNYVCGGLSEIDMVRIRATLKRRRMEITASKKADVVDDGDDAWIERELENGIVSC